MSAVEAVRAAILNQVRAWNDGDLEGFVATVHEDVVYVTPHGLLHGKESLLEAYRGDWRKKQGTLTVEIEQVMDHGTAVTAVVRYWLLGSSDDRAGWSLLTFTYRDGAARLIADASMRAE